MIRLIIGTVLGISLSAAVFVLSRAVERQPSSSSTLESSNVPALGNTNETATYEEKSFTSDREETLPSDSTDPVVNRPPAGLSTMPEFRGAPSETTPNRTTPFEQEFERLRELGLDGYRKAILSILQGHEPASGLGSEVENAVSTTERSVVPMNNGKPDPSDPFHDDSSSLDDDHKLIDRLILEHAPQFGFDPRLLHAMCMIESNFNPRAVSPKQAKGAFQLIDATANRFQVRDVFNPRDNLLGALRYLQFLTGLYGGDRLELVLSAYNCGEECVERFGRRVPSIPETRAYVSNVLRLYRQTT